MKKFDEKMNSPSEESKKSVESQLYLHAEDYVQMIKSYPQLLNPDFKKGEPTHGVYHKIETGTHPPCRTKRRPIVMDSAKAAAGKAAWEKMEKDGVIERVKAGTNTDWSSALHLVPKPGPGARSGPRPPGQAPSGLKPDGRDRAAPAKAAPRARPSSC